MTPCFRVAKVSADLRRGALTKECLAVWRLWTTLRPTRGQTLLRQLLRERPWSGYDTLDPSWVAELETKLKDLLD